MKLQGISDEGIQRIAEASSKEMNTKIAQDDSPELPDPRKLAREVAESLLENVEILPFLEEHYDIHPNDAFSSDEDEIAYDKQFQDEIYQIRLDIRREK